MKIYLIFKMKLLLYEFSEYKFLRPNILSSYYKGFLTVLFSKNNLKSEIIVFQLESNQYSSFLMSTDVSDLFNNSEFRNLDVSGNYYYNTLTIVTNNSILAY